VEGHACRVGIGSNCVRVYPSFARRALAYRVLWTIVPERVLGFLGRGLERALVAGGVSLPGGVDLPGGWVVFPDVVFPGGWEVGDALPEGVFSRPRFSPVVPEVGGSLPLFVEIFSGGPIRNVSGSVSGVHRRTFRPEANGDDCVYMAAEVPEFSTTASYGRFGRYDFDYSCRSGIRFRDVVVPQGASIISAKVRFRAVGSLSGVTCNVRIKGEDVDDAAIFSDMSNYTLRARTTAYVDWNSIGAWVGGNDYESPELKTVVQEIIDRAGWVSGNDLVLFFEDNSSTVGNAYRDFVSRDASSTLCAALIIEW